MEPLPFPGHGPAPAADEDRAPSSRRLTPRQERFCQAYVECPNAARAARRAGYSPASAKKQGWRLLGARRVSARIAAIQAALARDAGQDLETLIGKLEVVYRQAIEDRVAYAAARAVELQARLAGVRRSNAAADDRRVYDEQELQVLMAKAEAELRRATGERPERTDGAADVFSDRYA